MKNKFEDELLDYINNKIISDDPDLSRVVDSIVAASIGLIDFIADEDKQLATITGLHIAMTISKYLDTNFPKETKKAVLERCVSLEGYLESKRH